MCKSVWDEETWSYIILNHDRLIFKEFNNGTKLMTSYTYIFFIVLSFAYIALSGFQSNGLFFDFFFVNTLEE